MQEDAPQLLEALQGTSILASMQLLSSSLAEHPAQLQAQYDSLHEVLDKVPHPTDGSRMMLQIHLARLKAYASAASALPCVLECC